MQAKNKVEIRESTHSSLGMIGIDILAIGYGLYEKDKFVAQMGSSTYWVVLSALFCFLLYQLFTLGRRKVILLIDDQGVYHKDLRLMKWEDILSIKRTRVSGEEGKEVVFLFQTTQAKEPHRITISGLDISEKSLIKEIQKFKDYNIYDVARDDSW
jgi:hypothetical protein